MAETAAIPSLGGYDEEFVNAVEEDCLCPICQLPLKEAIQTSVCGHRFCRQCLDGHFMRLERDGNPLSCPVDRNNLIRDKDIFPDKATQRKILSLIIRCPSEGCQWTGELRSKDDHLASCPLKVVPCTNENCYVTLARKNLELHLNTTCRWRLLCCDRCSLLHPACKTEAHQNECRRFPLNCPKGCGVVIAREEISAHIDKDCVLAIISCPFAQIGCTQEVQRGDVEHHLQTDMRLHLDLTFVKLTETEVELRNTQEELFDTKETTRKLEGKLEETTRKLEEKFQETTRNLQEKAIALENRLTQCLEEHTWRISGCTDVLRQAKSGEKKRVESSPFYTGKCGYKFKIRLYPNGSGDGKTTHLSIFFVLMKGDYDPILPWPFHKKVTFSLIDQQEDINDQDNIVISLTPDPDHNGWNSRPVRGENAGRGFTEFVSHEELRERRFFVDDTIFIRVKIAPVKMV